MPATEAVRGYGSTVEIGVGDPAVFTKLLGVEEFEFPDQTPDLVDATHLESPNDTEESIAGMKKQADWSVQIQYAPGGATDTLLEGLADTGETVQLKLTPNGGSASTYAAYVRSWRPTQINAKDKMMATLTMTVMAKVVAP